MCWGTAEGGGWGGYGSNEQGEEVNVDALAKEMAPLGLIKGGSSRVSNVEPHQELADVGSGFP